MPAVGLVKGLKDLDSVPEMLDDGAKVLYIPINPGIGSSILSGISEVISRRIGHRFVANEPVDLDAFYLETIDDCIIYLQPTAFAWRRPLVQEEVYPHVSRACVSHEIWWINSPRGNPVLDRPVTIEPYFSHGVFSLRCSCTNITPSPCRPTGRCGRRPARGLSSLQSLRVWLFHDPAFHRLLKVLKAQKPPLFPQKAAFWYNPASPASWP